MEVFAVVFFCVLLLLFMRVVGAVFGQTIGTLAGIGCVGVVLFAAVVGVVILLLPLIIPVALFAGICVAAAMLLRRAARG